MIVDDKPKFFIVFEAVAPLLHRNFLKGKSEGVYWRTYLLFASKMTLNNIINITVKEIAHELGHSEITIKRALKELNRTNLIIKGSSRCCYLVNPDFVIKRKISEKHILEKMYLSRKYQLLEESMRKPNEIINDKLDKILTDNERIIKAIENIGHDKEISHEEKTKRILKLIKK